MLPVSDSRGFQWLQCLHLPGLHRPRNATQSFEMLVTMYPTQCPLSRRLNSSFTPLWEPQNLACQTLLNHLNILYAQFFRCLMWVECRVNGYVACQYVHTCWVCLRTLLLTCSHSVLNTLHINFYFIKWTTIFKYIHLKHFNPLRKKLTWIILKYTICTTQSTLSASVCYHSQLLMLTGIDEIPVGITETWLQTG